MYLHASHVDTFSFGVRSLNSLQTSSREIPVCCVVGSRNKHVLRFILVAATVSRNLSKPVPGLVFISRGAAYIPHGRTTSLPFCDKPVAGKRLPALLAKSWNVYLVSSPVKSPWQCAHTQVLSTTAAKKSPVLFLTTKPKIRSNYPANEHSKKPLLYTVVGWIGHRRWLNSAPENWAVIMAEVYKKSASAGAREDGAVDMGENGD